MYSVSWEYASTIIQSSLCLNWWKLAICSTSWGNQRGMRFEHALRAFFDIYVYVQITEWNEDCDIQHRNIMMLDQLLVVQLSNAWVYICKWKLQACCLLQGPNLLTPIELLKASLDVAKGAKHLEALKFVHRSAATSNLLSTSLRTH